MKEELVASLAAANRVFLGADPSYVVSRRHWPALDSERAANGTYHWKRIKVHIQSPKASGLGRVEMAGHRKSAIHHSKFPIWFTHIAMPPSDRPELLCGPENSKLRGRPSLTP